MSSDQINAFVFSGFAGSALLIAVVGVAGVLTFSVSARTREFGVRLAIGSPPRDLVFAVLRDGLRMAGIGIVAGAARGAVLARVASSYIPGMSMTGAVPLLASAFVLLAAALIASLAPALRASRVDVLQTLRSE